MSFRDVEDLLAERGILVSYESVRRWVNHFGPMIAADLRKRRPKPHTIWHLDEVYLKIDGRMVYLWRAVDAEGEVLDVLNAVDGATIELRIRISRPDEGRGRCKGLRAWDPRKDFSQYMQQPTTLSTSSAISARTHRAFRASAMHRWHEVVAAA